MKKSLIFSCLALAMLASCSNDEELVPSQQKEIAFTVAANKATRAALEGTTFEDGQKIYISAYNSVSGNYFKGVEFGKDTDTWKGGKYWPVNGVTSFLAYTAKSATAEILGTPEWGDKFANSVTFTIANGFYNAGEQEQKIETPYADLLYANGEQAKEKDYTAVPMTFKHAGAWVVFNIKLGTDLTGASVTVNTFQLAKIFNSGKFVVDNGSYALKAAWDFSDETAADYDVQSFAAKDLSTTAYTFGSIIPEQAQTAIKFNYTLSGDGFTPQTVNYEYPLSRFDKWEMGKKYVYNITISFKEIEITPSVTEWEDNNANIAI